MKKGSFNREELRRAAAAHITARDEQQRVTDNLVRTVQAAAEAGMSMTEIAEQINNGSRDGLRNTGLAA